MDQMPELAWSYGKIGIPVYLFAASPLEGLQPIPESPFTGRPNTVFAYEVEMQVYGQAFRRSYTDGDNSMVIATDSMKNFVLQSQWNLPVRPQKSTSSGSGVSFSAPTHMSNGFGSMLVLSPSNRSRCQRTVPSRLAQLPFVASTGSGHGSQWCSHVKTLRRLSRNSMLASLDWNS